MCHTRPREFLRYNAWAADVVIGILQGRRQEVIYYFLFIRLGLQAIARFQGRRSVRPTRKTRRGECETTRTRYVFDGMLLDVSLSELHEEESNRQQHWRRRNPYNNNLRRILKAQADKVQRDTGTWFWGVCVFSSYSCHNSKARAALCLHSFGISTGTIHRGKCQKYFWRSRYQIYWFLSASYSAWVFMSHRKSRHVTRTLRLLGGWCWWSSVKMCFCFTPHCPSMFLEFSLDGCNYCPVLLSVFQIVFRYRWGGWNSVISWCVISGGLKESW